jgi:hypothetical protein
MPNLPRSARLERSPSLTQTSAELGGRGLNKATLETKVRRARAAGNGYRSIARALGVTRDQVRRVAKRSRLGGRRIHSRLTCLRCGTPIAPTSGRGRPRLYCSSACKDRRPSRRRAPSACVGCGTRLEQTRGRGGSKLWCSPSCRRRADLEHARVRKATERAIARGELVRPSTCSRCGTRGGRILAHHEDYAAPLDVVWLCSGCHRRTHADIARATAAA